MGSNVENKRFLVGSGSTPSSATTSRKACNKKNHDTHLTTLIAYTRKRSALLKSVPLSVGRRSFKLRFQYPYKLRFSSCSLWRKRLQLRLQDTTHGLQLQSNRRKGCDAHRMSTPASIEQPECYIDPTLL